MEFSNRLHSLCALASLLALAISPAAPAFSADKASDFDDIFLQPPEQTVTSFRAPRPLSQTAENTTVITSQEITALNAHTLADVLDMVPGIQQQHNGGPGITTYTYIQSADFIYSQVFIDGVSLSNLQSNYADVSLIPAQIIDRIEIIKGAASSAWGSALGGVINVITKSPNPNRPLSGSASASIGSRTTADTRAEFSGSTNNFGYYISGGYLGSDGLLPTMQNDNNNFYTKLTYSPSKDLFAWGTFNYNRANMGDLFAQIYDTKETNSKKVMIGSFGLNYSLGEGLNLELLAHHSYMSNHIQWFNISNNAIQDPSFPTLITKDTTTGLGLKLGWQTEKNLLVLGSEYNHLKIYENINDKDRSVDRFGIYLNDTKTIGSVSISPSVRLDHTQTAGDQISYSLGATWQINSNNTLRAYAGRGFGLPILTQTDTPSSKILTTQVGIESVEVPRLWLKGTLFRNMTWGGGTEQRLAMGYELEARTVPIFNTSLGASYTFTETTRTGTRAIIPNVPTQTVQLSLRYSDKYFSGLLTGRHIYFNSQSDYHARNGGLIWDLHLQSTLLEQKDLSLEAFFSARNLFNTDYYVWEIFPSVGRWFEGGLRVRF